MTRTTVFYCVHVSKVGQQKWRWSEACSRAADAAKIQKALLADDSATVAFLVRMSPERGKEILIESTLPRSAAKLIANYFELLELLNDA